jgi:DNA-binding NtrC family response regulator
MARIAGLTIELPPLRERREDLGTLIGTLLPRVAPQRASAVTFTEEAARALHAHRWPLNVRELEKCLAAAAVLAGDDPIDLPHLPPEVVAGGGGGSARDAVAASPGRAGTAEPADPAPLAAEDAHRREELIALLREHRGNISAVARAMGKARTQIQRWVKRYRLDLDDYKG